MINLYNEDCLKLLQSMKNEFIDLTFTSPPYYNAKEYSFWKSYEEYLIFLEKVFTEVFRVTCTGRMCIINISPVIEPRKSRSHESIRYPIPFNLFAIMSKIGWKYLDDIIWVKPSGAAKNRNGGFFQHRKPVAYKPNVVTEMILVFQKPAPFLIDKILKNCPKEIINKSLVGDGYEKTNVWSLNPEKKSNHPAPFPVALSDKIIQYYSFVGDNVLDPFVGSGTTMISCKNYNRHGFGIDIHKKYIDLAFERLEKAKGGRK